MLLYRHEYVGDSSAREWKLPGVGGRRPGLGLGGRGRPFPRLFGKGGASVALTGFSRLLSVDIKQRSDRSTNDFDETAVMNTSIFIVVAAPISGGFFFSLRLPFSIH